jgi:hypothetical protein
MIPLAIELRKLNNNIFIGSGKEHLALFRAEMEGVTYIDFPGFRPGYSKHFPQYLIMLLKTPLLLYHIILEHFRLRSIIRNHDIDIVISDNRFGLWNKKVTSVYVTHLPRIPLPKPLRILEFIGIILHRFVIKKFTFCFIPDLPGDLNVSGRLSHDIRLPGNVRYIGILSRFINCRESAVTVRSDFRYNTVILSGPEPQRGIFRENMITLFQETDLQAVIFEGRPDMGDSVVNSGKITFYNHLSTPGMKDMITGSDCIISRSGYTTIMDLICLRRGALLVPTPGQTEQEYLADYLSHKGWFSTVSQDELNKLKTLCLSNKLCPDEIVESSKILLAEGLKELIDYNHKKGKSQ